MLNKVVYLQEVGFCGAFQTLFFLLTNALKYSITHLCLDAIYYYQRSIIFVTDKGNGGQQACPKEWKKCKEEHE
jgi:hypothetical protein